MRSLFIDTSSLNLILSIIDNNKILYKYIESVEQDMSNKIIPMIDDGFKKCPFELKDIDKIFIVNGPGSFTGVRIGVTVAKTIAYCFHIDVVPISSLEFIATTNCDKEYIVPLIDARRGNVFAGIYDKNLNNILPDQLINYNELINKLNSNYQLIGYNISDAIEPSYDILKIINKHLNDKPINPHLLNPRYLKLTEAEEKLNDKKNK